MPDTATSPAAGLLSVRGRDPVPLRSVDVRAELSIIGARVTVTQRYINSEELPIEAVYVFPLDEGAAVCGFEAVVDGVRFAGEVLERDKAFERYDDAMMRGDGAYLLDEERPDVFVASIGNLPPGKEVTVEISYVSELRVTGDEMRFVLPTTVAPRYAPASDRAGVGRPDSETLNPPLAADVPYALSLHVDVALPDGVRRIESPSHPVSMAFDGTRATVTLAQQTAALDRDFLLTLQAPFNEPHVRIEQDEEGRASLAISIVPRFEIHRDPSEVLLLVDRSGSMEGSSIEQVRNALQLCLRALEPGCRFNIYSFGTSWTSLFPESRLYDDESLSLASEHVARMDAGMGGTEILPVLQAALDSPRQDALPRQIIVLTDGEVTNTYSIIDLAARATSRIFTVGIGNSASHHLVRGLARAGRGSAEFIYPGERIEPKVVRLFDRLLSLSVTDVRVDWGGMRATQVPHDLTSIFSGERLVLYGLEADVRATTVRIAGRRGSQELAFAATIDPSAAASGRTVATLAARARIRELEEYPDRARGSRQPRVASPAAREIVALSMRYRVISRETSFVAVEQRDTSVEGDVQLRRVPIRLADGWGGIELRSSRVVAAVASVPLMSLSGNPFSSLASKVTEAVSFMAFRRASSDAPPSEPTYSGDPDPMYARFSTFGPPDRPGFHGAVPPARERREYMHRVLGLQRANGAWKPNNALSHHVGIHIRQLADAMPRSTMELEKAGAAWATAIAIAWCRRYAPHLEDEWGAAVRKGRTYLESAVGGDADAWIGAALALFAEVHVNWNDGLERLQEQIARG